MAHRLTLVGVSLVAVLLLLGGWFVGVQPQLARMGVAQDDTATMQDTNAKQEARLASLKADNANLDTYKAQLQSEEAQIPAERSQQALLNQLEATAAGSGSAIKSVNFEEPLTFAPPERVDVPAPAGSKFFAVPMTITVEGARPNLEGFVAQLQRDSRIVSVTASQYTGSAGGESAPSLTLTGATWVLVPSTAAAPK